MENHHEVWARRCLYDRPVPYYRAGPPFFLEGGTGDIVNGPEFRFYKLEHRRHWYEPQQEGSSIQVWLRGQEALNGQQTHRWRLDRRRSWKGSCYTSNGRGRERKKNKSVEGRMWDHLLSWTYVMYRSVLSQGKDRTFTMERRSSSLLWTEEQNN